jgi:hypothetical protein
MGKEAYALPISDDTQRATQTQEEEEDDDAAAEAHRMFRASMFRGLQRPVNCCELMSWAAKGASGQVRSGASCSAKIKS